MDKVLQEPAADDANEAEAGQATAERVADDGVDISTSSSGSGTAAHSKAGKTAASPKAAMAWCVLVCSCKLGWDVGGEDGGGGLEGSGSWGAGR